MSKPKVYVSRRIPEEGLSLLQEVAELHVWQKKELMPRETQLQLFSDCDGLLTTTDIAVNAALLESCPAVKVVSNYAVGFDNIDVAACTACGVPVGNTPGVLSETTADLAFTLILATARRVVEMADWVKQDQWKPDRGLLDHLGTDVHHATLGIIGLGRIGREVAQRATGFNMKILYHDLNRYKESEKAFGAVYICKEHLLQQSDIVSLHLPLSEDTFHYIGEKELRLMKPTAILINTARGQIVDQPALLNALKDGQIAGVGLDVTDPEPMRSNNPLLSLPQVTVLPHIGSATRRTRAKMAEMAAQNLIRGLSGEPMLSCVNPEACGTVRSASIYNR
jgi:glyoxylate reductase